MDCLRPLSHTLPVSVPPQLRKSSGPWCPSLPLLPVWMNVYFVFPWCRSPWLFDSVSVLVVRGGAVCLPTPPSWFPRRSLINPGFAHRRQCTLTESFTQVTCYLLKQNEHCCQKKEKGGQVIIRKSLSLHQFEGNSPCVTLCTCMVYILHLHSYH